MVAAVLAIAAIGYADVVTGQLAMSLFYLVPVALIGWWFGFPTATIVAIAAAGAWLWSDVTVGAYDATISYWNAFTRLVIFAVTGWFVAKVRHDRIRLRELNAQLEESLRRESLSARRDEISGLPNSRAFDETLTRELARSRREGSPIGLAYIDLDNFKRVNDTLGHHEGDELLRRVAQAIFISVREVDYCARLGGDEFAVIIVQPAIETYDLIASRLYDRIRELAGMYQDLGFGATTGFAHFHDAPKDNTTAVRLADEAMYDLKLHSKGTYRVREIGESS